MKGDAGDEFPSSPYISLISNLRESDFKAKARAERREKNLSADS